MMIKLDLLVGDAEYIQNNLEKPCCDGKQTHECQTHFLTPLLKSQLRDSVSSNADGTTAQVLAELAKYDTCRTFLCDEVIIGSLVNNLNSNNIELLTQSCRALANIGYEFLTAQTIMINKNCIEAVNKVISREGASCLVERQLTAAAVGFILNLVTTDDTCHQKVIALGMPDKLWSFARAELDHEDVTTLSQHVTLILVTLSETTPMGQIFTLPVCKIAVELLRVCRGPLFCVPALEFLEDTSLADEVKLRLVEAGLLTLLIDQLQANPPTNSATEEEINKLEMMGRVIANILTGDDAMKFAYDAKEPPLLDTLSDWLSREQYYLVYSSALCLGNVARTDGHSRDIVNRGIHRKIAAALQKPHCDMKMQHALLSTLRNLAIPKENKKRLLEDGVLEVLDPLSNLDYQAHAPVIFKLVGVWRQLADYDPTVAKRIGSDPKLLQQLVVWGDTTVCPWVSSEVLRLLCSMVIRSKDQQVMGNLLEAKAFSEITMLLTAPHTLMQMESVNALAIGALLCLSTNHNEWEACMTEAAIGPKIKLLLETPKLTPHLVENVCALVETLCKYDKLKCHIKDTQLFEALKSTIESRQDFSHLKPHLEKFKHIS